MEKKDQIIQYCQNHSHQDGPLFQKIIRTTLEKTENPRMLSGPEVGAFLQVLARFGNAARILEIGTFTGYAALKLAEVLPAHGIIDTCEADETHARIARSFFEESGLAEKIRLHEGPARETVLSFPDGCFDLIFVDADKTSYPEYTRIGFQKLRTGGIMVLDNMLWSGTVIEPKTEEALALRQTGELIQQDDRIWNRLFDIRDGLMVCVKLK